VTGVQTCALPIYSEHWLGRLLLRAGGAMTVVAPIEMASVQARTANAVLARYGANNSAT
jgi:predicted DNA-binding transcriptional regulator YafY